MSRMSPSVLVRERVTDWGSGWVGPYPAGIKANTTVEYQVEVLCWGNKDLSNGGGGVLYKVLDAGCGWDQPAPQVALLLRTHALREPCLMSRVREPCAMSRQHFGVFCVSC